MPGLTITDCKESEVGERILPSPELLRQLLSYEPETGRLYWKERPREMFDSDKVCRWWNNRFAHKEAFTATQGSGYRHGKIFGVLYLGHRVAWAIAHGRWPGRDIDHKNLDRSDNRLRNLREADACQNQRNRTKYANNESGYKGVSWKKSANRWVAQIRLNGRPKHLGCFSDINDARDAYIRAAKKHHGEFANYG